MAEDLIRELKEDIEREKWQRAWKRFGPLVTAVVTVALAAAAGHAWWKHQRLSAQAALGVRFAEAHALQADGDTREAASAFAAVAAEGRDGFALLASLRQAASEERLQRRQEAMAAYRHVAETASDPYFRNLAAVALASRLSAEEAGPWLDSIIGNAGPLTAQALEIRAAKALEAGRTDAARADLQALAKDASASESARLRASQLLAQLGGGEAQP